MAFYIEHNGHIFMAIYPILIEMEPIKSLSSMIPFYRFCNTSIISLSLHVSMYIHCRGTGLSTCINNMSSFTKPFHSAHDNFIFFKQSHYPIFSIVTAYILSFKPLSYRRRLQSPKYITNWFLCRYIPMIQRIYKTWSLYFKSSSVILSSLVVEISADMRPCHPEFQCIFHYIIIQHVKR